MAGKGMPIPLEVRPRYNTYQAVSVQKLFKEGVKTFNKFQECEDL